MMAVLDIRGTHGSGKSWIVHQLLARWEHRPILEYAGHIGYHLVRPDVAVLGKYTNECGGCDGIPTADEVVRRVRLFAHKYRHVMLEGILVSHTFKRYSDLAREMEAADVPYFFMFLNTPLKHCIARVRSRRLARGATKPFDPKNVIKDWHRIWERVRAQCLQDNHRVVELYWRNPLPRVLAQLRR